MAAETTISLAELSLFPATPDQVLESRTRHAVQWGRGQSLKDYVYKDELMEKDEHAAGGNLITWYAATRHTDQREPLSHFKLLLPFSGY